MGLKLMSKKNREKLARIKAKEILSEVGITKQDEFYIKWLTEIKLAIYEQIKYIS